MRKITFSIFVVLLIIGGLITFKSINKPTNDKDGNPLRYSYEELEELGYTGVFVHNSDGTFSPAIRSLPGFAGETENSSPKRFLWYMESDKEIDDMIPTVTTGGELVIVYNIDGDLPDSYYLEKYALRGYTIGLHVNLEENKAMYISSEDPLKGSSAASVLEKMEENTDDRYEVAEISGAASLPIKNVDPNMQLLLGLEKDKLYKFRYYQGTKEKETTFRADAKVFQSERYIPISTPYRKTNEGYFIVNLPENLPNGYYYISDIGFFAYNK